MTPPRTPARGGPCAPAPSRRRDDGMSTAEYAVGTAAAVAFAAVLFTILTSDDIRAELTRIIIDALRTAE
ncbi:uncharacterized protein DUF4244 [Haloactinospora alba]|uniref:Uncharacterized protein DUF4244 n=1 Tax=Haloactinospora alba TaxID=405555 RepID=A0A543NA42_9ACTN|nr:uncharacterized protein DUF4244 [Haloactinospora alba]